MPLDLDSKTPMYGLGQAFGLGRAHAPSGPGVDAAVDMALVRPTAGLALLREEIAAQLPGAKRDALTAAIARCLEGTDLPEGPVGIADQGPFWIGFYHQQRGERIKLTPEQLRAAGEALYGPQWQTEMSHGLDIATRRVRKWMERSSVPAWASAEVYALLMIKSRTAAAVVAAVLAAAGAAFDARDDAEG